MQTEQTDSTIQNSVEAVTVDILTESINRSLAKAAQTAQPAVRHVMTFEKRVGRALDDAKSDAALASIMSQAMTVQRVKAGWSLAFEVENPEQIWDDVHFGRDGKTGKIGRYVSTRYGVDGNAKQGFVYKCNIVATCLPSKLRGTLGAEFDNIAAAMHEKGSGSTVNWNLELVDGHAYHHKAATEIQVDPNEQVGYVPFEMPDPEVWADAFKDLYGLDDYIQMIWDTLEAAVRSGWDQRVNLAFIGPPACGKSALCKALVRALGAEVVLEYDATSTTAAGAQGDLDSREELPRVLIIEELEKADPSSLSWLLSVLDLRGEIRKQTARGDIHRNVHMVGICTINNEDLFEKIGSGALASRFAIPLYFQRPSRDILTRILEREIDKVSGDYAWIPPTLDLAEDMNTTDPRRIIAYCMTGREGLLDGSYQKRIKRIHRPDTRFAPAQIRSTTPVTSQDTEPAF